MVEDEPKKGFVWYSLRVSFWVMIVTTLILPILFTLVFNGSFYGFVDVFRMLFMLASTLFTFVVSIIHLNKYKEKTFAIVALAASVIFPLIYGLFAIGMGGL
ncbi:hypothetical protein J4422_02525 [Candidatus Pacearchaeota archaeon]|nr:hypothetical protein [Candidatus Pacearchaeota archaeon]